jgi:tRNA (cmo5U34)-methyltransferase
MTGAGSDETMTDNSTPHQSSAYDEEVSKTIPFYPLFHAQTIDLVQTLLPDVSVWLDTGCGTGYLAEHALPAFPKARFLLADPSQAMLDQARIRLARFPAASVDFLGAFPSEELASIISETPQVISAIQCHHYGGDDVRRRATDVCFKLLGEGGLYVTFENIMPGTHRGIEVGLDRWCRFQKESGRSEEAVEDHRSRFGRNYFPITVDEHLKLLQSAGFRVAELFWLSHMQAGFYAIK